MKITPVVSGEWTMYEIHGTGKTIDDIFKKHGDINLKLIALLEHVVSSPLGPTNLSTKISH